MTNILNILFNLSYFYNTHLISKVVIKFIIFHLQKPQNHQEIPTANFGFLMRYEMLLRRLIQNLMMLQTIFSIPHFKRSHLEKKYEIEPFLPFLSVLNESWVFNEKWKITCFSYWFGKVKISISKDHSAFY